MTDWLAAVDQRLRWLARRRSGRRAMMRRLTRASAMLSRDPADALGRFQAACLQGVEAAMAARPDLAAAREELAGRLTLARAALAGDDAARRALQHRDDESDLGGAAFFAGRVPGRVAWLAAMAAEVPEEVQPASVMLVNDLQALGRDTALRALEAAARY